MVVYELYLYIIIGYMREIFKFCISTVGKWVEERIISCKVDDLYNQIQNLPPYEFAIHLYLNFEKWNVKFQAK